MNLQLTKPTIGDTMQKKNKYTLKQLQIYNVHVLEKPQNYC